VTGQFQSAGVSVGQGQADVPEQGRKLVQKYLRCLLQQFLIAAESRQSGLEVKDTDGGWGPEFPPNVDELRFHVRHVIKDIDRLKLLFELFTETLDQLCRMGSAYEDAPGVQL